MPEDSTCPKEETGIRLKAKDDGQRNLEFVTLQVNLRPSS